MQPPREQEASDEPRRPPIDLVEAFVAPIWHARYWICLLTGLGLAVATFRAAIEPNTYEATGKLLVRAGAREGGSAESRIVGSGGSEISSAREAVMNELHLLASPKVFENVVRKIGADRLLAPYDPQSQGVDHGFVTEALHAFQDFWFRNLGGASSNAASLDPEAAVAAATKILQRALVVRAEMNSSVLTVTCNTSSPQLSADLVNAFMAEARASHQAVFSSSSTIEALDQMISEASSIYAAADKAAADYRLQCDISDADGERAQLQREKMELEANIRSDEERVAALEATLETLENELKLEKKTHLVSVANPAQPNPLWTELLQRTFSLKDQIDDLNSESGLSQETITKRRSALTKRLQDAEKELLATSRLEPVAASQVEQPNPHYERLFTEISATKVQLASLRAEAEKRKGRRASVKDDLAEVERCSPMLNFLQSEASKAKAKLDQFAASRSAIDVLAELDRRNLINLRELQRASSLSEKSGPRRGRMVMMGGLIGGALSVGFALLRSRLGRRFRSPGDVKRLLGTPVLGLVPEVSARELARRREAAAGGSRS
ncbi:MAG: hypothetical protein JNM84_28540 [Planctomycetes bacterium]|nr:hypothetical protein [Planctomycetota bacterium]